MKYSLRQRGANREANAPIKLKLQHPYPPPPDKPRPFDYFLWPGSGEFGRQGLPWGEKFELCQCGVGKIEQKCQVSNDSVSLTAIKTCLDDIEEFKGRDVAISLVTFFFTFSN